MKSLPALVTRDKASIVQEGWVIVQFLYGVIINSCAFNSHEFSDMQNIDRGIKTFSP